MQTVSLVLQGISLLCSFWLTGLFLYHLVLTFFGFGKAKKDYADHDPQSRFLVLVPAHNEERVIGDIIDNLQAALESFQKLQTQLKIQLR